MNSKRRLGHGILIAIVLGPAVWVNLLGHAKPVYAAEYPALVSIPLAFAAIIVASLLSKRDARSA